MLVVDLVVGLLRLLPLLQVLRLLRLGLSRRRSREVEATSRGRRGQREAEREDRVAQAGVGPPGAGGVDAPAGDGRLRGGRAEVGRHT